MGRDCCPHAGCILCGTKCDSGRKGSGDRCREEVCQVQRFVIQPYFYSGGCRVSWPISGRRSSFYYRDWQKNDFQHGDPRETASCTNASLWRFNATTPCVLQTLLFLIRRSHSGQSDIIIFIVIIVVVVIIIIISR